VDGDSATPGERRSTVSTYFEQAKVELAVELGVETLSPEILSILEELVESERTDAYDDGHTDGYSEGEDYGYSDGYENGRSEGYDEGYDEGVEAGREEAEQDAA
jgi:flagellar biosynthesis/type III secretory pathway protein FliH